MMLWDKEYPFESKNAKMGNSCIVVSAGRFNHAKNVVLVWDLNDTVKCIYTMAQSFQYANKST